MIQGPTAIPPVTAGTQAPAIAPTEAAAAAPSPELVARFESMLQNAKHSQHHSKGRRPLANWSRRKMPPCRRPWRV